MGKKILKFILVFQLLYCFFLHYACIDVAIFIHRLNIREQTEGINKECATLLVIPQDKMMENDEEFKMLYENEFSYKGELYDILEMQEHDGNVYIYCKIDEKEKNLRQELASVYAEDEDEIPTKTELIKLLLKDHFYSQLPCFELYKKSTRILHDSYSNILPQFVELIPSPPPKQLA